MDVNYNSRLLFQYEQWNVNYNSRSTIQDYGTAWRIKGRRRKERGEDHLAWRRCPASMGGRHEADDKNGRGWMRTKGREREKKKKKKSVGREERKVVEPPHEVVKQRSGDGGGQTSDEGGGGQWPRWREKKGGRNREGS